MDLVKCSHMQSLRGRRRQIRHTLKAHADAAERELADCSDADVSQGKSEPPEAGEGKDLTLPRSSSPTNTLISAQ